MIRIDAHLHLWNLHGRGYSWITPSLGALYQDFTATEAREALDTADIDQAILVQADDTLADTEFLLRTAAAYPWIRGVVGWIQLDDSSQAHTQLQAWSQHRAFCGVRHLMHNDPRDGFLALKAVRRSLRLLADAGLAFDIPDAFPRHLGEAADLAAALPELTVVIDHLGKPPLAAKPAVYGRWHSELADVARQPNVVAKLSGLRIPGARYDAATLAPVFDTALELFGPNRLMYGGDWPMTVSAGGYEPTWRVLDELINTLSESEQSAIRGGTAARVYSRKAESWH